MAYLYIGWAVAFVVSYSVGSIYLKWRKKEEERLLFLHFQKQVLESIIEKQEKISK